jgi:hypothetical protein
VNRREFISLFGGVAAATGRDETLSMAGTSHLALRCRIVTVRRG